MRKATFTVGDTAPPLTGTCRNGNSAASLVGATLSLELAKPSGRTLVAAATPTDAVSGDWEYQWGSSDIDEAGEWSVRVVVTFGDGKRQTFGPTIFLVQE